MAYAARDLIAGQLRALNPDADWDAAGVARDYELADIFVREGINDISKLTIVPSKTVSVAKGEYLYTGKSPDGMSEDYDYRATEDQYLDGIAFSYNGRIIGYMGSPDPGDAWQKMPIFQDNTRIAWSAAGHGNVDYRLQKNPRGGWMITPTWGSSSDAAEIRGFVLTAGALGLSAFGLAGFNVAGALGQSIIGPTLTASYPGLASAVGQVAISTAFNGGDVQAAVKRAATSAVIGQAGAVAGSAALSATDLEIIGKTAEAATRALLSGGDVTQAVAMAVISNPAAVSSAIESTSKAPIMEIDTDYASGYIADAGSLPDWALFPAGGDAGALPDWAYPVEADAGALPDWAYPYELPPENSLPPLGMDDTGAPPMADLPIPQISVLPPLAPQTDPSNWSSTRNVITTLSEAATAVLKLRNLYNGLDPQARRVEPTTGRTTVALNTGYVQTRDPTTGRVVTTKPPVNAPQATVNGGVVVNLGNGTYMLISSDGTQKVIRYDSNAPTGASVSAGGAAGGAFGGLQSLTAGLSSLPPAAILGGVGLLIFLMKRR